MTKNQMAAMEWGGCDDPNCHKAHLVDPQTEKRHHRKESRVGQRGRANKALACRHCGYRFQEWQHLWVMKMHFEFWHDTEKIDLIMADRNTYLNDVTGEPVDMATADEITKALKALAEATTEARQATADLHSARKDAAHFIKQQTAKAKEMVEEAVSKVADEIERAAAEDMRVRVAAVIDGIEADWRTKLGLD